MCLIIVSSNPTKITRADCASAIKKNDDGIGVMWYDANGRIRTEKWLDIGIKKWWPQFRAIAHEAESMGSQLAVHFRFATHGEVSEEMCHPFEIRTRQGKAYMMHNGVISGYGEKDFSVFSTKSGIADAEPAKSDTWEYARMVEAIVADGGARLLRNTAFLSLLGTDISSGNKLVFAVPGDKEKRLYLVNEKQGVWHHGHWFSNTYAWDCPASLKPSYSSKKYGGKGTSYPTTIGGWYGGYYGSRYDDEESDSFSSKTFGKSAQQSALVFQDSEFTSSQKAGPHSSLYDIEAFFRNYPTDAVQSLSEIPVPSRMVQEILDLEMVGSTQEAAFLLSKHLYEVAREYYETVVSG